MRLDFMEKGNKISNDNPLDVKYYLKIYFQVHGAYCK